MLNLTICKFLYLDKFSFPLTTVLLLRAVILLITVHFRDWLTVKSRVVQHPTYKVLNDQAPSYLKDLILSHIPIEHFAL